MPKAFPFIKALLISSSFSKGLCSSPTVFLLYSSVVIVLWFTLKLFEEHLFQSVSFSRFLAHRCSYLPTEDLDPKYGLDSIIVSHSISYSSLLVVRICCFFIVLCFSPIWKHRHVIYEQQFKVN